MELKQPTAYALSILGHFENRSDQLSEDDFDGLCDELEQFLAFNFGINFKRDHYKMSPEERSAFVDKIMQKFTYNLYLKVGASNISQNKVSEHITLNQTMVVQDNTQTQGNSQNLLLS